MAPIKILTSFLCLFVSMKSVEYAVGFRFEYSASSNYGVYTILSFVVYKDGEFAYC